ncbi:MAG: DUF3179 domain-containing protein [Planctomycetaceae bacterium]
MTDAVHSYDFSQQAEAGRPRPRLRKGILMFAIAFGVLCVSGFVFREPLFEFAGSFLIPGPPSDLKPEDVIPAGLSDDERLMYTITHAGGQAAKNAIKEIVAKHDQRYVGVLLEALIAAENNPPGYPWLAHNHYYNGLMTLIGGPSMAPERLHKALSDNFLTWYTATALESPAGYTGWKGQLFSRIDPVFGELIYEGVPTAVRMEEVRALRAGFDVDHALDDPRMVSADEAAFLTPEEPVFGIEIDGDARAYPDRILQWHPVVNDVIGTTPVTLAYGAISGSAAAYDGRASNGKVYTFGSAGLLYRSSELLFDQETQSVWCPLTGRPLFGAGVTLETRLNRLPVVTTTWEQWRSQFPQTMVLDVPADSGRSYEPGAKFGQYFAAAEPVFSYGPHDDRLTPKSRVYGVEAGGEPKAYPLADLAAQRVVNDVLGGEPLVLACTRGTIPVKATVRAEGRRGRSRSTEYNYDAGGEVRVYARGGNTFELGPDPDSLVDESGHAWQVTTAALVPENGETLPRINGVEAYWFAWSQHHVGTDLYGATQPATSGSEAAE